MSGYIDDLAKKIAAKVADLGGGTRGYVEPVLTIQFLPGDNEWQVWVPVKPPGQGDGIVTANAVTLQKAVQDVAREVGVL